MKAILSSVAVFVLAAMPAVSPAKAAIVIETDFTAVANGVTANPNSDLATATSVGVETWMAQEVVDPLGGLTTGTDLTLTNPIPTAIGGLITISWDGGTFSDITKTSGVSFVGDELDLTGSGILTGPGVPTNTKGVLDLSFTQAGGAGDLISGSGSFTATSGVPEPSTWAMLILGGLMLTWASSSRKRTRYTTFGDNKRKGLRSAF